MIFLIIIGCLVVAILLAFSRLVRGPTLSDKIVALDLMASLAMGISAVYAVRTGESLYIDIAVALALIAFLSTVAFAHYIEKGEMPWRKS